MFFLRIHSLNPSLSSQENNTESEASSSSNPNPQNTVITINDARIKTVNGTIHLYRNAPHPLPSTSHSSHDPLPLLPVERGTLLFVLAVRCRLTVEDFLRFCGIVADPASDIRIIRNDAVEDRYSVIVNFDDQKSADNFYRDVNGWRYPEGEVCHILFLDSVVHAESTEIAGTSHAGSTELPTCPVCLERLDQDISGITATTCDHSFECSCISEWANSTCSVCHFCQEHSQKPACSICGTSGIHWICIICGFVGCGRYKEGHAIRHWKDTQHCYSLDLETQRVWDYVGDTYVHRLNQSRSDDKWDKSKSRNKSNGECCENLACTEDSSVNAAMSNSKVESIVVEYNRLLESQLESQRQYYETLIEEAKGKREQCISEAVEKAVASKMQDMHLQIESVMKEKKRVADSNEILVKNQNLWRNKIIENEERRLIMDSAEHDNIAMENLENQPDSVSSSVGKKPVRSTHSEVWEYFQKNEAIEGEKQTCYCKECKKTCYWGGMYGTSDLRKHISKCSLISLKALKENHTIFDQNKYRELMAKAIVRHNLPFMFVHYEGIREVFSYLNDKAVSFSKNTSRTDVLKLYEMEKSKLKCFLKTCSGRVSLTTDLWTSINTDGYITLTAHFIDDEWKLQKKLLSFCLMPPPHSGVAIFEKISSLLRSWGIEDRIFAYTLDNASSNDKFVELLESHLLYRKALIANGEYLHVRCATHILNLMVQDGLKCISSYLANIRESIKYIKGSQSRKKYFVQCIADLSLDNSNKELLQDVPTRWNSTFIMLKSAIYYEQALCRLQLVDKNYVYYPTQEEWVKAKRIADFLEVFYDATCLFSGTKYPTSNLFFPKIVLVLFTLQRCMKSNDFMFEMASSMFLKFNKYWNEFSVLLCIACILDPRYKIDFVKFWYKKLYGNDYSKRFEVVKMKLEDLYEEYKTKVEECNNEASGLKNLDFSDSFMGSCSQECADVMEEFDTFRNSEIAYSSHNSELKLYLEDGFLDRKLPLDILSFWKSQQFKYPILSLMAKDVLAVPITTVASESVFSISGRVLDDYRSSLKDDIVEALLCTRDWLYGNVSTMEVEQQIEDITKFHIDEEQSTQFPTLSLGDY